MVAAVAATTAGGLHGTISDVGRTVVSVTGRDLGVPEPARSVVDLAGDEFGRELGTPLPSAEAAQAQAIENASSDVLAADASVELASGESGVGPAGTVADAVEQVPPAATVASTEATPSSSTPAPSVAAPTVTSSVAPITTTTVPLSSGSGKRTDVVEALPDTAPPTTTTTTTSTPTTTSTTTTTTTTSTPTTTTTATVSRPPSEFLDTVATTAPPSTTTTTTTTTTPPPAGPGCTSDCSYVGFQDLKGRDGVTLENLVISNPSGRCLDLTNARNITIRNVTIRDCGTNGYVSSHYDAGLIHIENADNITIESSLIDNMSNESFGSRRNNAIQVRSSKNITVKNNSIRNVRSNIEDKSDDRGSRAIKVEGQSSYVSIRNNHFYNAGRNAVQISRVSNAPGMSITENTIEGRGRWDSDYEDMINLFSASGTSSSPIRIANNSLRNGGPSSSGTGMILGDGNDRTGATRYVLVEWNTLIDPGHVGINLAGGDHITIRNNTIIGRGDVPLRTTTGFGINDYGYTGGCRDHVVTGNRVWMENQHLPDGTNHLWNPGTCVNNNRIEGNVWGDSSLR